MRRPLLLSLALIAAPAWALRPTDAPRDPGVDRAQKWDHPAPLAGAVHRATPVGQSAGLHRPGWQAFLAADGAGWAAIFDEVSGLPLRAWGPPIPLDLSDEPDADAVGAAVLAFAAAHADAVGMPADQLALRHATRVDAMGAWFVDLDHVVGGLPVDRAGLTARVVDGRLVLFGVRAWPDAAAPAWPTLRPQEAVDRAILSGPHPAADHEALGVELVAVTVAGPALRAAWRVTTETAAPVGRWVALVDGLTGEVLRVENEVRYAEGAVLVEHDERTVDGSPRVTSPLPHARLATANGTAWTEADGRFAVDGAEPLTGSLQGRYFRVRNEAGTNATFTVGPLGETVVTDAQAHIAELSGYVFAHHARDWGQAHAPEVRIGALGVNVNIEGSCNAYFDGRSINFLREDRDCNNTARVADIVYHEWGHGFHGASVVSGWVDGSVGEGASDTVAFLITGDPRIGPHFLKSGGPVRNVAPDRVYPDDFVASDSYVHSNGLIFGGAFWDLWTALVEVHGPEAGTEAVTRIFTGTLKAGPTIPTTFVDALFADDDNGDLSDGTPNDCTVFEAFQLHGLSPLPDGAPAFIDHLPLRGVSGGAPTRIEAGIVDAAPQCSEFEAESAWVTWRVDGGAWQTTDLDVTADGLSGELPAWEDGALVEYYLTAVDADGDELIAPTDGPIRPFSAYVGDVIEVFCTDLEADDGGFVRSLVAGQAGEGALDWQWGVPTGQGGDPAAAASGARVWGNDLGEPGWNGQYQDSKHTRLETPPIDTRHYRGTFLSYMRWLSVEDGVFDQARILADEAVVWTNHATNRNDGQEHHVDTQWQHHAVPLAAQGDDGEVVLAWELISDAGLTFGGWTVDDVCLFAPATADNRLGLTDLVVEEIGRREVRLSWTQPIHGPIDHVVVVRTEGRLPTGPDDGELVARLDDVAPGAPAEVIDDRAPRRADLAYAVFPSDGVESLGWTIEGYNAQWIRLGGGRSALDGEEPGGCDTGGSSGAGWAAIGLLGLLLRRRRR